jgi:hypothetical protein
VLYITQTSHFKKHTMSRGTEARCTRGQVGTQAQTMNMASAHQLEEIGGQLASPFT